MRHWKCPLFLIFWFTFRPDIRTAAASDRSKLSPSYFVSQGLRHQLYPNTPKACKGTEERERATSQPLLVVGLWRNGAPVTHEAHKAGLKETSALGVPVVSCVYWERCKPPRDKTPSHLWDLLSTSPALDWGPNAHGRSMCFLERFEHRTSWRRQASALLFLLHLLMTHNSLGFERSYK